MRRIELPGEELISEARLHAALQENLQLPAYYGANLDALWDCLTGWVELPMTIIWRDFAVSRRLLGDYADRVLEVLREAEAQLDGLEVRVELGE